MWTRMRRPLSVSLGFSYNVTRVVSFFFFFCGGNLKHERISLFIWSKKVERKKEESKKRITQLEWGNNRQLKHREVAAGALVGHFTARGIYGNRELKRVSTHTYTHNGMNVKDVERRVSRLSVAAAAPAPTHTECLTASRRIPTFLFPYRRRE